MHNLFNLKLLPLNLKDDSLIKIHKKAIVARTKLTEFSVLAGDFEPYESLINLLISKDIDNHLNLVKSKITPDKENSKIMSEKIEYFQSIQKLSFDIGKINNYSEILNLGIKLLKKAPISKELILKLSKNEEALKKEIINEDNLIKSGNTDNKTDYYTITQYLDNLILYINDEITEDLDPIVKAAIIYAQIINIYNFSDEKNYIAKTLIILYLLQKKIINKPIYFVSKEIEKDKVKYRNLLISLKTNYSEWEEWIIFFLDSLIIQINKNIETLKTIEILYSEMLKFAKENKIKPEFINLMFKKPVFSTSEISKLMNISYSASRNIIKKLLSKNKLSVQTEFRTKFYTFTELYKIKDQ